MVTISAAAFVRHFGHYQREAQREPIEVSNHGAVTGYFISGQEFAEFQKFKAIQPRAYHPSELPDHLTQALLAAEMPPGHEHLNDLLKD